MVHPEIEEILTHGSEQIRKLNSIVTKALEEEALIVTNLLNPPKEILSRGQRNSDKVARF
jgi:hypothetical protein